MNKVENIPPGEQQPLLNWSTVVARGLQVKVPTAIQRNNRSATLQSKAETLYEDEDITDQLRAQKAAAIIQQALHPDTVLFTFADDVFTERTDAYRIIEKEIGEVTGFRPISLYGNSSRKELIIEAKFKNDEDGKKAISDGFSHKGIQYHGTPSADGAENKMIKINLSHLPLEDPEDLRIGLMNSLSEYGRVVQIKRYTTSGYFEGEAMVLIDCAANETTTFQRLERMLYLTEWDTYVPASYKGAPPVCYHCRQAGHIKKECPKLANLTCFNCQMRGHTTRSCKNKTSTFRNDIQGYLDAKANRKKEENGRTVDMEVEPISDQENTQNQEFATEETMMVEKESIVETEKAMEIDSEITIVDTTTDRNSKTDKQQVEGVSASQHAPIENATHMKVDTAKEMLAMTSTKSKRKLPLASKTPTTTSKKSKKSTTMIDEPIIVTTRIDKFHPSTTTNETSRRAHE